MEAIKEEIAGFVFNIDVTVEESTPTPTQKDLRYTSADETGVHTTGDVSRNSPCPCGSGKKYKRCHGAA
jgi:preprotein translocase subunit SecA